MQSRQFITWFFFLLLTISVYAQPNRWPVILKTASGAEIKLYEPAPESYSGNLLKIRAAISVLSQTKSDPVFGVLWADVTTRLQGSSEVAWQAVSITNINLPGVSDKSELLQVRSAVENMPAIQRVSMPQSELQAKLHAAGMETKLAQDLNTNPPAIIYKKTKSILVLIDGQPDLQQNTQWGVKQVVNTPFTIVQQDNRFYLYGDKKWYMANAVTGPWAYAQRIPSSLSVMDREVRAKDTTQNSSNEVAEIVVSTIPAELIQSDGEANLSPVEGTSLLYMTNTANDIFLDINSQQYYVLISGRWYKARGLNSAWTYTPTESLPAGFAAIPENSAKGNVLANVAGTSAAQASVMDAQVPQTAKVDRKNATASVTYDGEPQFENIEGTGLQYAVNTPGSVLLANRRYYYVENGVWFESDRASGPWYVATQRPGGVENIPPSYPVYNVKYVYIYDATPDYVYMGYTPGYLGTYIYGPTIVYGTGYRYRSWRGRHYYPRPVTWGFNVRYTPWSAWGFSLGINSGWFYSDYRSYGRGSCWGGWWGPTVYRPPYYQPYYNYGRYNGRYDNGYYNDNAVVMNRSNNVYRNRQDVVTYEQPRYENNRSPYRNTRPVRNENGGASNGYNNSNGSNVPAQRPYADRSDNRSNRTYNPVNGRQSNGIPDRTDAGNGFPATADNNIFQRTDRGNNLPAPEIRRNNDRTFPTRSANDGIPPTAGRNGLPVPDIQRNNDRTFPTRSANDGMPPSTGRNGLPVPDAGRPATAPVREYRPADAAPGQNRGMNEQGVPGRAERPAPVERPAPAERQQEARMPERTQPASQPEAPRQRVERPTRENP